MNLFFPDTESEIPQEMGSPATPSKFSTEVQVSEFTFCFGEERTEHVSLAILSGPSSFVTLFCFTPAGLVGANAHTNVFVPNAR